MWQQQGTYNDRKRGQKLKIKYIRFRDKRC